MRDQGITLIRQNRDHGDPLILDVLGIRDQGSPSPPHPLLRKLHSVIPDPPPTVLSRDQLRLVSGGRTSPTLPTPGSRHKCHPGASGAPLIRTTHRHQNQKPTQNHNRHKPTKQRKEQDMGTNYYLKSDTCPHCGRAEDRRHIGKSSGGWVFGLHVYPDEQINTLEDWQQEWSKLGTEIINEYGARIRHDEILEIITKRGRDTEWGNNDWYGYESEADFHRHNHSLRGPNGLLRRQLTFGCIGHGPGTWDYMTGDFS